MTQQAADEVQRMARGAALVRGIIQGSIARRWGSANWDILYPWWRQPSKVRILMYADGDLLFSGGTLDGLIHVKTLLESHLYFYADFEITTAHRGRDHSASKQSVKLTDLNLDDFDEIWLFGFNDRGFNDQLDLTAEQKTFLDNFMNEKKGGVLVTGDHSDSGKRIGGGGTKARHKRPEPTPGGPPGGAKT